MPDESFDGLVAVHQVVVGPKCVERARNFIAIGIYQSTVPIMANDKLTQIAEQLRKGVVPPTESVRTFLEWFGAERRGYKVVQDIRAELSAYKIATDPDFEYQYIDNQIAFKTASPSEAEVEGIVEVEAPDPTYRIGRLEPANKPPTSVKPDHTIQQVITIMLSKDYSQLPVMTSPREVKGMVTWKSIGSRLALKRPCITAKDCMEAAQIISNEESLFSAIRIIASYDYVLVQAHDKQITGIVTASDFNEQFRKLAEPFLWVGEIENGIRRMLLGKFNPTELKGAKAPGEDGREVESVVDLTFGEYIRLIQVQANWDKLKIEIDRNEFVARLDRVGEIRNDVMHFDSDGLEQADLETLREFASFLKRLRDVGAV